MVLERSRGALHLYSGGSVGVPLQCPLVAGVDAGRGVASRCLGFSIASAEECLFCRVAVSCCRGVWSFGIFSSCFAVASQCRQRRLVVFVPSVDHSMSWWWIDGFFGGITVPSAKA